MLVDYTAARSVPLGALAHIFVDPRGYPGASVEAKCTGQWVHVVFMWNLFGDMECCAVFVKIAFTVVAVKCDF